MLPVRVLVAACLGLGLLAACSISPEGLYAPGEDGGGGAQDSGHPDVTRPPDGGGGAGGAGRDGGSDGSKNDGSHDGPSGDGEGGGGTDAPPDVSYTCHAMPNVSDCSLCKGYPLGCVYCTDGGYVGECLQGGLRCEFHVPDQASMCPCGASDAGTEDATEDTSEDADAGGDATPCPLPDQVCIPGSGCGTCGEGNSHGFACQNGLTCKVTGGVGACK